LGASAFWARTKVDVVRSVHRAAAAVSVVFMFPPFPRALLPSLGGATIVGNRVPIQSADRICALHNVTTNGIMAREEYLRPTRKTETSLYSHVYTERRLLSIW
jgi:hypothetical protein